jgi:hypothetical protein
VDHGVDDLCRSVADVPCLCQTVLCYTLYSMRSLTDAIQAFEISGTQWGGGMWTDSRGAAALQVLQNWTFSLFFCAAELWGGVVISVLFWSLANELCTVAEAKAIYPSLGLAANLALVVAGSYVKWANTRFTQVCVSPICPCAASSAKGVRVMPCRFHYCSLTRLTSIYASLVARNGPSSGVLHRLLVKRTWETGRRKQEVV